MPELPDVEGFRRFFDRHAAGKRIERTGGDASMLRNTSMQALARTLKGRRFESARRHGKWLLCRAHGPVVMWHFGMTGEFHWGAGDLGRHRHDRIFVRLSDGELRYRNMRKLGGVWLAADEDELDRMMAPIGLDAFEISQAEFMAVLQPRRGSLKGTLMSQRWVAGLGNLTADETLWNARIDPRRPVPSTTEEERARLYDSMRSVLAECIPYGYVPGKTSWLTGARGRDGRCPRCDTNLSRAQIAARTTYWCRSCQQ